MNYVGVRLQNQYNTKTYWYFNELDNIDVGDFVVVSAGNYLQVAEVLEVKDEINKVPSKWIIDKIDLTKYKIRMSKVAKRKEIRSKINERVNYLKNMITLDKLMKEDLVLAELVDELNKEEDEVC